jgi:hypothetical protein
MDQALSPKAAEHVALRESTLKGAERTFLVAYRALKGPVYLPFGERPVNGPLTK